MKQNNNGTRFVFCNIFAFFLSLFLVGITCLTALFAGFFSQNLLLHGLEKSDYYHGVKAAFYDSADALRMPTGLPESVLEDLVSDDMVVRHVNDYLAACMKGKGESFEFETLILRNRLQERINAYLQEENITPTEQQLAGEQDFIDSVEQEYIQRMKIPLIDYYSKASLLLKKTMLLLIPACLLLSIFSVYFIFRMNKWKHRAMRFVAYGTLGSGVMCFLAPFLAYLSGFYERIQMRPEYFYRFLVQLISDGFLILIASGVLWFLISLGLLFWIRYLKKNA